MKLTQNNTVCDRNGPRMTLEQAAMRLGVSVQCAHMRETRAMNKLRKLLEPEARERGLIPGRRA